MNDIVTETTRSRIRSWHPDADTAISEAGQRLRKAAAAWNITLARPLTGGAKSIVCLGHHHGTPVVIKAPLDPADTTPETAALEWFTPTGAVPRLLEAGNDVLLMEHVNGQAPAGNDGQQLARALTALHQHGNHRKGPPPSVPPWEERRPVLFNEYADRIHQYAPDFHDIETAAVTALDTLLNASRTLLHGDVQAKNLLTAGTRVTIIDPLATIGPLAWEYSHAACSVTAAGGNAEPVITAAARAGITMAELAGWLRPAAIHHAGTTGNIGNPAIRTALRQLLDRHPET